MRATASVQIVQMTPLFRKSPYGFLRRPNNKKKPLHLLYLHSRERVLAVLQGVQP